MKEMVQSKVLASADGAKSTVREVSGMGTEGNKNYELWSVIEFVVDTGFPDNRRHCHFHASVDLVTTFASS